MSAVEKREQIQIPNLIIRAYTPEEEAARLVNTYKKLSYFKENDYKVVLPNIREYPPEEMSRLNLDSLIQLMESELYDPTFYEKGIETVKAAKKLIERGIDRLVKKRRNWFHFPNSYEFVLTRYGVGGSYDYQTGKVVMRTTKGGRLTSYAKPAGTGLHEIYHIGTEEHIVLKYGLSAPEKERMIDLLCLIDFGDLNLIYRMQPISDYRIDPFVTSETIDTLPDSINRYVQKYPRQS